MNDAARWFQKHGIAAFALMYRLMQKTWQGPPPPWFDSTGRWMRPATNRKRIFSTLADTASV